jgi:hypothetical protein
MIPELYSAGRKAQDKNIRAVDHILIHGRLDTAGYCQQ